MSRTIVNTPYWTDPHAVAWYLLFPLARLIDQSYVTPYDVKPNHAIVVTEQNKPVHICTRAGLFHRKYHHRISRDIPLQQTHRVTYADQSYHITFQITDIARYVTLFICSKDITQHLNECVKQVSETNAASIKLFTEALQQQLSQSGMNITSVQLQSAQATLKA